MKIILTLLALSFSFYAVAQEDDVSDMQEPEMYEEGSGHEEEAASEESYDDSSETMSQDAE